MSKQLDDLIAQVTTNTTVTQGALTMIGGLRQQILDAGTDPAKLTAITESLRTSDDALAAALVTGTPAATDGSAPPMLPHP